MSHTEKDKETAKQYREARRQEKLAKGLMKNLESSVVVKGYGFRVVVSTFNRYDVDTINIDGTINCEGGTYNGSVLRSVDYELKRLINKWVNSHTDHWYNKYIAVVDALDNYNKERRYNYIKYVPKNKHIKVDITLKQKNNLPWKEVVSVVTDDLRDLYDGIVGVVEDNGLTLKDFKGHNLKNRETQKTCCTIIG